MRMSQLFFVTLLFSALAVCQAAKAASADASASRATLPITFTNTVSADHARVGDVVRARTTQTAKLESGESIPAGAEVIGHVAVATPFIYDSTPYASQKESVLEIQFDSVHLSGRDVPLKVVVRAMADPLTSWGAREPKTTDLDSLATLTQIGGDQVIPSQAEVMDRNGDVVAYHRGSGVYAHLIAHAGCDASNNEVPVDIYSASACGLYGFSGVTAADTGSIAVPSRLSLTSTHTSPKIWKHTTALLEMLPDTGAAR